MISVSEKGGDGLTEFQAQSPCCSRSAKTPAHTPSHSFLNIQSATHFMYNFHHGPPSAQRMTSANLPKFLSLLPILQQRQQFVAPNDVQVIFVLGLNSRQNNSAFIHLAIAPTYLHLKIIFMVRCGSRNHDLFVA